MTLAYPKPKKMSIKQRLGHDRDMVAAGWRDAVIKLDHGRCRNRNCPYPNGVGCIMKVHHIIYKSHGGNYVTGNGILLCDKCEYKCHHGCNMNGIRLTAYEFMIHILAQWKNHPDWRWDEAYQYLKRRAK